MKRTSEARKNSELRSEYKFDYASAKPNRFADRTGLQGVAVLLEPDVARVFKSAESVNKALRALISPVSRQSARVPRQ